MKTTKPTHKKLPRARVMFTAPSHPADPAFYEKCDVWCQPAALIPCHTPAQARRIVKAASFLQLSEEEQVEAIISSINNSDANYYGPAEHDDLVANTARAVLAAMGLNGRASK